MDWKEQHRIAMRIQRSLEKVLDELREARPKGSSGLSRNYAIATTEAEKVLAYWKVFVVDALERKMRGQ